MAEDRRIIHEITPLMGKDVLYIADRHKKVGTKDVIYERSDRELCGRLCWEG